jgi:DNA transformation protein
VTPDDIQELFSVFGVVAVRRMFGGAGIYAHGTMFALVADGVIYLKADERSTPAFERENLPPFTYATNDGKHGVMSYRRMPDRLYDDPDELATWARAALAAAQRTGVRVGKKGAGRKVAGRKGRNKISAAKNYASKTTSAKKSITKRRVSKRRAEK